MPAISLPARASLKSLVNAGTCDVSSPMIPARIVAAWRSWARTARGVDDRTEIVMMASRRAFFMGCRSSSGLKVASKNTDEGGSGKAVDAGLDRSSPRSPARDDCTDRHAGAASVAEQAPDGVGEDAL